MGLLARADTGNSGPAGLNAGAEIRALIANFHRAHSLFHILLFRAGQGRGAVVLRSLREMTVCHGAECAGVSGGDCLVLLPGSLDMELFSHRLSASSGSVSIHRFSADSVSAAVNVINRYLR